MLKVWKVAVLWSRLFWILPALCLFAQAGALAEEEEEAAGSYVGIQRRLWNVFEKNCDALVKVTALKRAENSAEYFETASGFFVERDGTIMTTALLTHNAEKIWIENRGVVYDAQLVGFDFFTSVSVIRVSGEKKADVASFIEIKPCYEVPKIATLLFSISCEFGFSPSPRMGVLSGHSLNLGDIVLPTVFMRSNIPSFRGSIGGAVFDIRGNFAGMTVASLPDMHGSFVIPPNSLFKIYGDIQKHSRVIYAWFGLNTADSVCRGKPCVRITKVIENSPALRAGLNVGDVVLKVNSVEVESNLHLRNIAFFMKPGQSVEFEVRRKGNFLKIPVALEELSEAQMRSSLKKLDELQRKNQDRYIKSENRPVKMENQALDSLIPQAE